jgi:phosphoribosylanthranilate isomerase
MTGVKVKTCGLKTLDAVLAAKEAGADYLGFIFFEKSPRNITAAEAAKLATFAPAIPVVAVTVDADDAALSAILKDFTPAYLQLHGKESPTRVAEVKQKFGLPVIKALSIKTAEDVQAAHAYEEAADMLMFDAKSTGPLPGGNGLAFDWQLLAGQNFTKPWFLSGGLNADNVEQAVRISGAKLLDVSSGLETAPGVKSPELIKAFVKIAKGVPQ